MAFDAFYLPVSPPSPPLSPYPLRVFGPNRNQQSQFQEPDAAMSDIRAGDWAERHAPAALLPYIRLARLDRPIGTWLLLFPGWWSVAMASSGRTPDWLLLALFAIGAVAMRGAGCTLNDLIDRDLDAQVTRTQTRPLPSG